MGTKNFLYWQNKIKNFYISLNHSIGGNGADCLKSILSALCLAALLFSLTACDSLQRRNTVKNKVQKKDPQASSSKKTGTSGKVKEDTFVEENPDVEADVASSGEQATNEGPRLPKVGVILGPGGVKAFAHTGVIKELLKANINIDAIVGLEWGALVAALYAQKKQIHDVEWKLYKLNPQELLTRQGFSKFISKKNEPITLKKVQPFLSKNIESSKIQDLNLIYACPSLSLWSGTVIWQDKGLLSKSVERCWPYPPLFQPKSPWMSASFAVEESVQYLKNKGVEVIIFVNVLGRGQLLKQSELMKNYTSAILWHELNRSLDQSLRSLSGIEVVQVQTRRYRLYDFKNRQALVKAGEQAGRKAADRIALKHGF